MGAWLITQVVKRRGESMAAAAKLGKPHGMLSVIGLGDEALEVICAKARAATPEAVCQIANYLFPTGRVISGHKAALDEARHKLLHIWTQTVHTTRCPADITPVFDTLSGFVCHEIRWCWRVRNVFLLQVAKLATAAGAMKAVPLAVSGAFHTSLMQPASEALVEVCMLLPPSL